jgi:AbrB family looped-hinge helix DNA binding protein
MATAVLTSKGQVTIPAEVRRRMGIDSGDRIEFIEQEDGRYVIEPAVDDVRSLKGLLRRPDKPVSIDDMEAAIRSRALGGSTR